jgi:hypothetical protein
MCCHLENNDSGDARWKTGMWHVGGVTISSSSSLVSSNACICVVIPPSLPLFKFSFSLDQSCILRAILAPKHDIHHGFQWWLRANIRAGVDVFHDPSCMALFHRGVHDCSTGTTDFPTTPISKGSLVAPLSISTRNVFPGSSCPAGCWPLCKNVDIQRLISTRCPIARGSTISVAPQSSCWLIITAQY